VNRPYILGDFAVGDAPTFLRILRAIRESPLLNQGFCLGLFHPIKIPENVIFGVEKFWGFKRGAFLKAPFWLCT